MSDTIQVNNLELGMEITYDYTTKAITFVYGLNSQEEEGKTIEFNSLKEWDVFWSVVNRAQRAFHINLDRPTVDSVRYRNPARTATHNPQEDEE